MIYEFALEPELVASWADRAAYRFFDGKFGLGCRRIASAFPAKDRWREMVIRAFDDAFQHDEPQDAGGRCPQCAKRQAALRRLEALLIHLGNGMVERRGDVTVAWREAVLREHAARGFHGILVRQRGQPSPPVFCADDLDESKHEWNPPTPPTPRKVGGVVKALEPMLRFATEVRFVDPYLDASLAEFFDPLAALLKVAQQRTSPADVTLEFHTAASNRKRVTGQSIRHEDIAREIAYDCRKAFAPVLKRGTFLRIFVWSEGVAGAEKIHNRYVLTNIGGVSVPAGLDRARTDLAHTDDFTVLSREQYAHRWAQYRQGSRLLKSVLGPEVIVGTG